MHAAQRTSQELRHVLGDDAAIFSAQTGVCTSSKPRHENAACPRRALLVDPLYDGPTTAPRHVVHRGWLGTSLERQGEAFAVFVEWTRT
jgi:hypothetical protein